MKRAWSQVQAAHLEHIILLAQRHAELLGQ